MKRLLLSACIAPVLALAGAAAWSADLALVIGNEDYAATSDVERSLQNQQQLAAALDKLGYHVISGTNLGEAAFRDRLMEFENLLPVADRVVVWFAGQSVTAGSQTWLAPTDIRALSPADVEFSAPSVGFLLDLLATKPGRAALFIGSPDEGFEPTGTLSPGVGAADIPQGVLLVTGDPDSVFAFLAKDLLADGQVVGEAVNATDAAILAQGFISPDLTFVPAPGTPAPDTVSGQLAERAFWALTESSGALEDYQDYLQRYPDGSYSAAARARISELSQPQADPAEQAETDLALTQTARRQIQQQLTILGYNPRGVDGVFGAGTRSAITAWQRNEKLDQTGFLDGRQIALLTSQAKQRSDEIAAEAERQKQAQAAADVSFWRSTGANGTAADLRAYLARYPDGIYSADARRSLDRLEAADREQAQRAEQQEWDKARSLNTVTAYENYLLLYPNGVFAENARARIADLKGSSGLDKDQLLAVENNLGLNSASKTLVERRLDRLGFAPGKVDGQFDRSTRTAIRRFQQSQGIPVTGYLDANTVRRLIVASPA